MWIYYLISACNQSCLVLTNSDSKETSHEPCKNHTRQLNSPSKNSLPDLLALLTINPALQRSCYS